MRRSIQRGFTLIELVVVIVVLGILAAFAVPKFMGLENQARVAAVNAMAGTLRSSAAMAHGVFLASGSPASNQITVDGSPVNIVFGYPAASTLLLTIQDYSGFGQPTVGATTVQFRPTGARTPANCWVQYNQAASATTAPTITYPTTGNAATIQQFLQNNC